LRRRRGALAGWAWGGSAADIGRFYGVGLGLSPYLFMLYRIANSSASDRGRWIDTLAMASLIHVSSLGNNFFRDQTMEWIPNVFDHGIAALDEAFGVQLSGVMAYGLAASPPLNSLAWGAYNFVQIPIVVVAAFQWRRRGDGEFGILPSFIVASIIGYTCYWIAPAMGPKYLFGSEFPLFHATSAVLSSFPANGLDPDHPRNAMPSLHFSWAMLVFLYTRGLSIWARSAAAVFVFLTACATLDSASITS
jgi:PAP2 superfamily